MCCYIYVRIYVNRYIIFITCCCYISLFYLLQLPFQYLLMNIQCMWETYIHLFVFKCMCMHKFPYKYLHIDMYAYEMHVQIRIS